MTKKHFFLLFILSLTSLVLGLSYFLVWRDGSSQRPYVELSPVEKQNINLALVEGEYVDAKGAKTLGTDLKAPVILVNFWASWCLPCLEELPELVEMRKIYSEDKLLILGINGDEDNIMKEIKKVQDKFQTNFPLIQDEGGVLSEKFQVEVLPTTYIFQNGELIRTYRKKVSFMSEAFRQDMNKIIGL